MKRVCTVPLVALALGVAACGGGEPSTADLAKEERAAFAKRVDERRKEVTESGLSGQNAEDLAESTARLAAGQRAYKLLTGDDEARGRAAAEAAGFDPDELVKELANEDPEP